MSECAGEGCTDPSHGDLEAPPKPPPPTEEELLRLANRMVGGIAAFDRFEASIAERYETLKLKGNLEPTKKREYLLRAAELLDVGSFLSGQRDQAKRSLGALLAQHPALRPKMFAPPTGSPSAQNNSRINPPLEPTSPSSSVAGA